MRPILAFALLLAACSKQPAASGPTGGTFTGEGRDRLCIAGEAGAQRAGLIAFGSGDVNCSASGDLQRVGQAWDLVPRGEGDCRIPLGFDANTVRVGQPPAACSYYCGPGASLANKQFELTSGAPTPADFGGDPLC
jgi:hypothetical protein